MRNIDMIYICHNCAYHRSIHYANGSVGIGCLAYDKSKPYPTNIINMKRCPLGKDEKK